MPTPRVQAAAEGMPKDHAAFAAIEIQPYGTDILEVVPANEKFHEMAAAFLPDLRLASVLLTKTKAELMAAFADGLEPDALMDLYDVLVEHRDYFSALSDLCNTALVRILIAGSAVEAAEVGR